jgi:hypothetical protein
MQRLARSPLEFVLPKPAVPEKPSLQRLEFVRTVQCLRLRFVFKTMTVPNVWPGKMLDRAQTLIDLYSITMIALSSTPPKGNGAASASLVAHNKFCACCPSRTCIKPNARNVIGEPVIDGS